MEEWNAPTTSDWPRSRPSGSGAGAVGGCPLEGLRRLPIGRPLRSPRLAVLPEHRVQQAAGSPLQMCDLGGVV